MGPGYVPPSRSNMHVLTCRRYDMAVARIARRRTCRGRSEHTEEGGPGVILGGLLLEIQ